MKDWDLQTLWCRGMSVFPSSTIMGVPLFSYQYLVVKSSKNLVMFHYWKHPLHFSDELIIAARNFWNLFNKLKEQLEVIKDGQKERNLKGKIRKIWRQLWNWSNGEAPLGKKTQASRKLSCILSSMFYQGQDRVDKYKDFTAGELWQEENSA